VITIISGLVVIVEYFGNLDILKWLYPIASKTELLYFLIIVTCAFFSVYIIGVVRKPKGSIIAFDRRKPAIITTQSYDVKHFDVRWEVYLPEPLSFDRRPWADGPYCPKCNRELEEERVGRFIKRDIWFCPHCNEEFPRPKIDAKDAVEKEFAAYLRRKGRL
jgi:ribosomal protein L37AE/L43A